MAAAAGDQKSGDVQWKVVTVAGRKYRKAIIPAPSFITPKTQAAASELL